MWDYRGLQAIVILGLAGAMIIAGTVGLLIGRAF